MAKSEETRQTLNALFHPQSIALIGATNNLAKWGGIMTANAIGNGFKGKLFPVNARDPQVMGMKAYKRVDEIPEPVDLACIVTPAETVPQLVLDCARKRIRTVLVISSDFAETGFEGQKRQDALLSLAREAGVRLVGPNSMGIFSSPRSLVLMMARVEPLKGDISFVSQSGNIGAQMLEWGRRLKAGFRHFVSSGNEADLSCRDYVEYFGRDEQCGSVMIYLESLKHPERWMETAREVARKKPVVVFKGGKGEAGQKAARSHSAALAGKAPIFDASFRQAGLIQARTTEAFIDCARSLARLPLPSGNRVGIITRGGGWGVVTTDACEEMGLEVPALQAKTIEALDKMLPPYWSRGNPVDLVAVTDIRVYLDCIEILMKDPSVDGVIALSPLPGRVASLLGKPALRERIGLEEDQLRGLTLSAEKAGREVLEGIVHLMRTLGKPVVLVGMGEPAQVFETLMQKEGLNLYPTPERAVRVMARLMEYGRYRRRLEARRAAWA